jgi:hypothetical protein
MKKGKKLDIDYETTILNEQVNDGSNLLFDPKEKELKKIILVFFFKYKQQHLRTTSFQIHLKIAILLLSF